MNVNLGCGEKKINGAIGVDFRKTNATDIIHDLRVFPWPFEDEQFENAIANDIIEHMLYVIPFLDECWRITKPGGHLIIHTDYFTSEQSYTDPTHLHYFTLESFDFFDPDTSWGKRYGWYTDKKWKVLRRAIDGNETKFDLQKLG